MIKELDVILAEKSFLTFSLTNQLRFFEYAGSLQDIKLYSNTLAFVHRKSVFWAAVDKDVQSRKTGFSRNRETRLKFNLHSGEKFHGQKLQNINRFTTTISLFRKVEFRL